MRTRDKAGVLLLAFSTAATLAASVALSGCGKDEQPIVVSAPPPIPPAPPPAVETPKEKPVYVYSGDRFRDPFVPSGQTGSYQPDAVFDPGKATVRGIIYGPGSKSAVLSTGGGGTYFIKAGKIFDIMGKTVEGYSAKVYADKVVVQGDADNVFELKIRNEEEKSL